MMAQFRISSKDFQPAYLRLFESGELKDRVLRALALLESCTACPRNCRVNRLSDEKMVCRTGRYAVVSSYFPHSGEEDCLRGWRGSGTIFFSYCNLYCVFCLSPEMLIPTDQGLRRIADLFEQGDNEVEWHGGRVRFINGHIKTITRAGSLAPVAKAFCHYFGGDLIRIKPFNCPPLLLTPNHEVFAVPKAPLSRALKVRADQLTKDYYLIVPKRAPGGMKIELGVRDLLLSEPRQFRKAPARRFRLAQLAPLFAQPLTSYALAGMTGYHPAYVRKLRGQWRRDLLPSGDHEEWVENKLIEEEGRIRFKTERRPGIPARITLDERLAWLLGIYCAKGHVHSAKDCPNSHCLIFSFGPQESDLVARTTQLLQELFGVQPEVYQRRTTVTVEVGKTSLALLLAQLCGKGADTKQVPSLLTQATTEILRAFLKGALDGDGCDGGTHLVLNTVSEKLAMGLFEIGLLLGVLPSFHRWQPSPTTVIEGRVVNQAPLYYVKFPKVDPQTGKQRLRWKETEDHFLVPVHKIERVPYTGPVFNLEIDDLDHSYLAPFVAVSNCQNYDISHLGHGREVQPEELAAMMLELQQRGCHNINFVTPEHVVPQILEAVVMAAEQGLRLPLVYNTGAYDSLESLKLLDGIVDIYMPDFKFWDPEIARRYVKAKDYPEAARQAITEMHRQVGDLMLDEHGLAKRGVLIRHLIMPGGLAGTREMMRFLAREVSLNTHVNLMAQYHPAGKVSSREYPEINRRITREEYEEAVRIAHEEGIHRLDARELDLHRWI